MGLKLGGAYFEVYIRPFLLCDILEMCLIWKSFENLKMTNLILTSLGRFVRRLKTEKLDFSATKTLKFFSG